MAGLSPEQIRGLFAQEASVRLPQLGQLLLQLEQADGDETLIGSVFRELHTLKGSAAAAGLGAVSDCAHQMEELVDELRVGRVTATPKLIDTLLVGTDRLTGLVADATNPQTAPAPARANRQDRGEAPVAVGNARRNRRRPAGGTEVVPSSQAQTDPAVDSSNHGPPKRAPARPAAPVAANGAAASNGVARTPAAASSTPAATVSAVIMVPTERLEELTRLVGQTASAHLRVGRMLKDRFGVDPDSCIEFTELSRSLNELQDRATRTQMVPVSTVADQLQRAVRDLSRVQGKEVRWETRGMDTEMDRGVLHQLADSLLHLVRNGVDHGIEAVQERAAAGKSSHGTIRLHAMQLGSEVIITVTDDGRGIDAVGVRQRAERQGIDTDGLSEEELLTLTFHPGLSTAATVSDISGRGVGLDVVRTNVEAVRGRVEVRSEHGMGTEYRLIVPITLAVLRCLLVEAGGQRYALPFHRVVLSQSADPSTVQHAEGRPIIWADNHPIPVTALLQTLRPGSSAEVSGPIVVLADTSHRHAFQVDRLIGQRDVVLKALSPLLSTLPIIAGASVEPDGSILIVLDPPGLIHQANLLGRGSAPTAPTGRATSESAPPRRILVVDDALTVRELQRSILERAGFQVRVATDGVDALAQLAEEPSDLVLTDIEMPTMDGFALTEAIRAHPTLTNIPILILSSRSTETDRQRGLDAGADGYIVKSGFDEAALLGAVDRLLGVTP